MTKRKKTVNELLEEALFVEDEQPFQVPENWVWVTLKDVCKINMGQSPKGEYTTDDSNNIPLIGGPADMGETYPNAKRYTIKPTKLSENGELIVSVRATLGKTNIADGQYCLGRGVAGIKSNIIDIRLLRYYFETIKSHLYSVSTGTTFQQISRKNIESIAFPLLPLNEQKRIADKVERFLSKIEEAKQLIGEAKETFELRRAAILDKAFRGELTRKWREEHPDIENAEVLYDKIISLIKPKKFEIIEEQSEYIPCKWKWVRLGEVVHVNPPKKKLNEVSEEQKCTFIPMPAVSDKTGKIEEPEEREYRKVKKGYTFFLENDVLFAKITPCMENGKSAIARQLKNGFGYGSTEFHVLRTSEYVNEQYIHYLVRSQRFRAKAKREMTGAVGQQRVPKEFLLNYPFPLPPKEEQDAIVNILDDIFAKDNCSKFNLQLESELDILKQSILSKAFRGELGTNDPSEENAIELLKEVLREQVK
ncbi:restriction endonuclease subunit S [Bacillus velezensis]|uniref:restriction endonuclease subunit S n=1 Tax=Bacillus velezensis TaxID=492670 RepID=UPI0013642286|nr:restriction endonuclease subunit S [Bacillus velezensis]QHK01348.1 Type-1 restriction enzyme EcoKI specificity protein [Bacillus velezensis]